VRRVLGVALGIAYVLAIYAFIYLPVVTLMLFSFQEGRVAVPPFRGPSLQWYESLFENERMMTALSNSVVVGLVSATIATLLGFLAAYGVARFRPAAGEALRGFLVAPLAVSYLLIGLGLSLGWTELGVGRSLVLVVIGHVVINLPLAFVVLLSQMSEQQVRLEWAARDLGASDARVLMLVTVPVLSPGILASLALCFTLSWDEFIIALLLTRFDVTLPVEIWSALRTGLDPETNAAGTLVFLLSVGVLVLALAVVARLRRRVL
jgi:spermidine/putrescine transport system permease protein